MTRRIAQEVESNAFVSTIMCIQRIKSSRDVCFHEAQIQENATTKHQNK